MSGLEVVGLLLGIFPLVVSALEHYKDVYKSASLLSRFEEEYSKTLDDIKYEQVVFHMTLEELLLPLSNNESFESDDLEVLLEELINGSDDNEAALQNRLGRTYQGFLEIATCLHSLISRLLVTLVTDKPQLQKRIQEKLTEKEPDSDRKENKLSLTAFQYFIKKQWRYRKEQVVFGFSAPHREEILKEVRKNNEKLEKLLEKSEKIANFKRPKTIVPSAQAVKALLQYWKHADRIYALMHHSWGCSCKAKHGAHLWLQHRTSPTFEFKLLLLWAPRSTQAHPFPPWDRQGLYIMRRTTSVCGFSAQPASASTAVRSVKTGNCKKRRVAFADVLMSPRTSKTAARIAGPVVSLNEAPAHGEDKANKALISEISRLCDTMTTCGMQAACIGSLNDREAGREYSVFSQPEQKIAGDEITLKDVLHDPQRKRLKRSERFQIALAIASSHLQLHSTPWARKQWEAVDIRFPRDATASSIMFDKPFVSADFNETLPSDSREPKKSDRSFACLGIMLMELLFGTCLEDHELWHQLGFDQNQAKPLFRLMVARQWADSVEDEAGPDFSAAVMWCLNESPTTLEGDQWRRDLADRVVLPIQNCCAWIQAKPPA